MIASIMQPTFMPWLGYFNIIKSSDIFVFLDDVQFEKRSWQQRNKILINKKEGYLTIPTISKSRFNQKINEVIMDNDQQWKIKHIKTLKNNYSKHEYFDQTFSIINAIYQNNYEKLLDLNVNFIKSVLNFLSIETKIIFSSQFNLSSSKENRILELCKIIKAKKYISPIGSKIYLKDGEIFKKNNIELEYIDYQYKVYKQKKIEKFVPRLSVIDAMFNLGKNTIEIL
jgi:hypothetical protein